MIMKKLILILLIRAASLCAQVNGKFASVDAKQGYTINGVAPNNYVLCGNGIRAMFVASCGTSFYQIFKANGSTLPQRVVINFDPSFSVYDQFSETTVHLADNISANTSGTAAALASPPTQCDGLTVASGIRANGNAYCVAPPIIPTTMATPYNTFGTTYTNSTQYRKTVAVTGNFISGVSHNSQITAYVNGIQVAANGTTNGGGQCTVFFIVPVGATYAVTFQEVGSSGGGPLTQVSWTEWLN